MIRQLIGLMIVLAIPVAPVAAEGVELKPKLKTGVGMHYVLTAAEEETRKFESAPDQPPQESESKSTQEVGMRLRCNEVKDDGSAVLEWALLYVAISAEGGRQAPYDSRDPAQADSTTGIIVSQIINAPATVTVDAAGKVIAYQDPATVGGGPVRHYMDEVFSENAFAQLNLFVTRKAPTDAAIGTTWSETRSRDLPSGLGTMLIASDYKLEGFEESGKTARIAIQGNLSMKQPEPAEDGSPAPPPGLVIDKGGFSGVCRWDCATGQLISTKSDATFIGTASGPWGKLDINQKSTSTLKRVTPAEFKVAAEKPPAPKPEAKPATEPAPKSDAADSSSPESESAEE